MSSDKTTRVLLWGLGSAAGMTVAGIMITSYCQPELENFYGEEFFRNWVTPIVLTMGLLVGIAVGIGRAYVEPD